MTTEIQTELTETPTTSPARNVLTVADRRAMGKALRERVSRASHGTWQPAADRRDPVELLIESSAGRVPQLIPIRYGRMLQSPFAFFRGAAMIMAADLAHTPNTGLNVQACGDCHLMNFGAFGTPERRMLFDINDFDETLPAPWEWDVKRLAASFVIASRHNGIAVAEARESAATAVRSYRENMARYAKMRVLDVWYSHLDVEDMIEHLESKEAKQRVRERLDQARERDVAEHDYPKLVSEEGQTPRIRDNPPLIYHPQTAEWESYMAFVREQFDSYIATLPAERRVLLDRFQILDIALKVVGVGSVGTRCGVILLEAGPDDPLFLQVKEARKSVLEPYAGASPYSNSGQRVVVGQRLMQAASDIFLGWTVGRESRHFYVRQLRDMKLKPLVETFDSTLMNYFARACGLVLARAHARSGDAAQIAGYLGKKDQADNAFADFSVAYADQNERDFEALRAAARNGRVEYYSEA